MGEKRRVVIKAKAAGFRIFDPADELLGTDFRAVDDVVARLVDRVQVDLLLARDVGEGLVEVGGEFLEIAGFPEVVPGGLDPAGKVAGVLKAGNVIKLTALQRDRGFDGFHERCLNIDSIRGICLFRFFKFSHSRLLLLNSF